MEEGGGGGGGGGEKKRERVRWMRKRESKRDAVRWKIVQRINIDNATNVRGDEINQLDLPNPSPPPPKSPHNL